MNRRLACISLFLLLGGTSGLEAQVRSIPSTVTCKECRIELRRSTELDPSEINTEPYVLAIDNAGALFYSDGKESAIKVFHRDGSLQSRFGREGSGPGELRFVRNLFVAANGTIHLLDVELGRHTVFTGSGNLVRSQAVPAAFGGPGRPALLRPDGGLVISGFFPSGNVGYSLIVTDSAGRRVSMLEESSMASGERWKSQRLLSNAKDGGFWVARLHERDITHYDKNLRSDFTLQRNASWFPRADFNRGQQPSSGVFDRKPDVMISAFWEDAAGLLWVLYLVPDPRWKSGPSVEKVSAERLPLAALESRPRYKTRVEVLDVQKLKLIAEWEADSLIGRTYSNGHVVDWKEDAATGEWRVSVSKFHLQRP